MIRKSTATLLFCLMMVVTATSQAGLRYCHCLHVLLAEDCAELAATDGCGPQASAEADDRDEFCQSEQEGDSPKITTGDSCSTSLTAAMGDYIGLVNAQISGKNLAPCFALISPPYEAGLLDSKPRITVNGARGSPSRAMVAQVPLFLWHSVFRL